MKKIIIVQAFKSEIFKEQKLTIGLNHRWSFYCVLDEAGHCQSHAAIHANLAGGQQRN